MNAMLPALHHTPTEPKTYLFLIKISYLRGAGIKKARVMERYSMSPKLREITGVSLTSFSIFCDNSRANHAKSKNQIDGKSALNNFFKTNKQTCKAPYYMIFLKPKLITYNA
tara:strand:+ start:128 stop:463 length:336 start_codon:yes stop_codon:yes gene_type:complete